MAEDFKPRVRERTLEELKKEITCAVCLQLYENAKLLPCNHYYCSTCIEKMSENSRSRGEPFLCPECQKKATVPPGGVAELQPAFFVEKLKYLYGKMAIVKGKVEAVCEQCSLAKCVAYCRNCSEFICGDCVLSHKKLKVYAGHVVASLEDLRKEKALPLKEGHVKKCSEHKRTLKLFCFSCECGICRDCTIINHRGHNFEFMTKCATKSRNMLTKSLAPLRKIQANMADAEKNLVHEGEKVEGEKEAVFQYINRSFEGLRKSLDTRREELMRKSYSLVQEKKDALAAQTRVVQMAQKEVQLLVELVERNVESTSDQDLMSIRKQLQTQMEEEEKRHRQMLLEPTATAEITVNLPSCDAISHNLGTVFSRSTPRIIHSNLNFPIELGSPIQMTLSAPIASLRDVSATLKCKSDPSSSLEAEVVENGVGNFNITVTPTHRGRHYLIVKVKESKIEESPLHVLVTLPTSQYGQAEPVKIGAFTFPWGITFNDHKQLVVAGGAVGSGKITVMERDGKEVRAIECDQFIHPRGVATLSDGTLYVTDILAKSLFKFDSEGKLMKTVSNADLQNPYSIKIIDKHLYIVDTYCQMVKIFDMDCNIVGAFSTKECPHPRDIVQGPDGLYVAGKGRICVYSYPNGGVFIRRLHLAPSSLELSDFWGICFDLGGNIIACDSDYGVYVFRPNGRCVSHISSDTVYFPAGVTVDEDGYLFVCSCISQGMVCVL